ncbi:MAG: hypothetical protein K0S68_350 [Candidatus Saccharibacteria bacterium]|jgi:hypothetical protein|nr:hypothetical protein [Candidatus Saccharibacteria bacterium]
MKFIHRAATLTGAAALVVLLAGCVSSAPPIEPTDVASQNSAAVGTPVEEATTAAQAPAASTAEIAVDDLQTGVKTACEVIDFEQLVQVIDGSISGKEFGTPNSCIWTGDNRSLMLEITTSPPLDSVMDRFSNDLDFPSPCPEATRSKYASQGGTTTGVWCERDQVSYIIELRTKVGDPGFTTEEQQALGPIMETVLARVG